MPNKATSPGLPRISLVLACLLRISAPWFAGIAELVIGVALILGFATRYAALATFIWVLVATAIAHRYWTYPAPAQRAQYNNFLKNLAIMGGALYVFGFGAGRFSVDAMLAKR